MHFLNTIPGVQQLKQTRYKSVSKTIFWTIVFLACAVSMVMVTVDRIQLYLQEPVNYLYQFERRDVLQFPSVTICPIPTFDLDVMTRKLDGANLRSKRNLTGVTSVYELLPDVGLEDIWKNAAEDIDDFLIGCYYTPYKQCNITSMWIQQLTALGPCYTITITEDMSAYDTVGIVVRLNDSWCPSYQCPKANHQQLKWRVLIHDWKEDITYKVLTHGHVIPPSMTCTAIFERTHHQHEHSSKRPCQSLRNFTVCEASCMDNGLMQNSRCRLPFMKTVANYPLCDIADDFKAMYRPIPFQVRRDSSTTLKRNCRCHRACHHSSYQTFFDSWRTIDPGMTKISFRPSLTYGRTTTSEQFRYGFIKLLCDIGAVLGFHMGISVLTLVELLEYVAERIRLRRPSGINNVH